jgi:fumarylpyruvate hydrolase
MSAAIRNASLSAKYLFAPKITGLSVVGTTDMFPVRRVLCVGKNYADHVAEMGGDAKKDPPLFFSKPADALVDCHRTKSVKYPPHSKRISWEAELVVAIGKSGFKIDQSSAFSYIFGFAVGVDITARDLQEVAKKAGRPWDMAKGFDESGPIGAIVPSPNGAWYSGEQMLQLTVNGEVRQTSPLKNMIWSVSDVICELSNQIALEEGDIIFTGTPSGVGDMKIGDQFSATCGDLPACEFTLME